MLRCPNLSCRASPLSKVFERVVSVRLGLFMERSGVLPTTQFAYQKWLGTCDALLCVSHTLKSALDSRQEASIVHIDFNSAFVRVNHRGILYKLGSVGIGGSVLSLLTQFLSNRSQYILVDSCRTSTTQSTFWWTLQGSVFCPLLFFCTLLRFFQIWKIN